MPSHSTLYDIERGATRRLYAEYRHILWERKLSMRPVTLAISNSHIHWGQWDPLTRTIHISKKLILEHSWFYVQAILRHEMAHQWVTDHLGDRVDHTPHGEHFRQACQKLGVLDEFTGASARLQSTPLDWRERTRDPETEKLHQKVQKLLALSSSSNEHEALLAMNKVREIFAKYNLDQESESSRFTHFLIAHGKKRIEAIQRRVASILVEHFFVKVIYTKLFDAKSGQVNQAIELVGSPENILMAEYVYFFLLQKSESLARSTAQISQPRWTHLEQKSYRFGILEGFSDKLRNLEKQKNHSTPTTHPSTDLTLIGKAVESFRNHQKIEKYLDHIYPRMKSRRLSTHFVDHQVYDAGKAAGKKITLNKAVTSQTKNLGRLLT